MSTPKQLIMAQFPKAKCSMNWGKGCYKIILGKEAQDFNNRIITEYQTNTGNPADAWLELALNLRII